MSDRILKPVRLCYIDNLRFTAAPDTSAFLIIQINAAYFIFLMLIHQIHNLAKGFRLIIITLHALIIGLIQQICHTINLPFHTVRD